MGNLTCVIIDDEPLARECISNDVKEVNFLKLLGEGNNPLDLLQLLEAHAPDLIFLDIQMPGLDGFAVIDRLSRNAALADVPLVIVSGCEISLEQHRELEAAGHRFFTKGSSSPREIVQSLREMVA